MSNSNSHYKFSDNGKTICEVGIVPPGGDGQVTKVKFTPINISPDEPVWVAMGRRIVELEAIIVLAREWNETEGSGDLMEILGGSENKS